MDYYHEQVLFSKPKEAAMRVSSGVFIPLGLAVIIVIGCQKEDQVIQRPEKIYSMRDVVYDHDTYAHLASLWRAYNEVYPSEDAYSNWMYAARYAGDPDYGSLLESGVRHYPANPTLLYLKSMVKHGVPHNLEAQTLLERAVALDPSYVDPWFSLAIHYLERNEQEKMNVALRKILESGAIADEVMDYSYNMIACLDENAILITNGDNDTYPGWILTRIVGNRPDVRIVNVSLLNTEWYPLALVREGVPPLIAADSLDSMRAAITKRLTDSKAPVPPGGPFADILIDRLVEAGRNAKRPVYLAATVYQSPVVKRLLSDGRELGLVTLVTAPREPDATQLRRILNTWVREFRTGGLDGWALRYANRSRAGKRLMLNYPGALISQMNRILEYAPDSRLGLFQWYRDHVVPGFPGDMLDEMNRMWVRSDDIGEIREWCRSRNLQK